jgi:hypothetical protein
MELVRNTSRWGADLPPTALPVCAVPGSLGSQTRHCLDGGFKSTMHRTKAEHLDRFATRAGRAYRRFAIRNGPYPKAVSRWVLGTRLFSAGPQISLDRRWAAGLRCLPRGLCTKAAKRSPPSSICSSQGQGCLNCPHPVFNRRCAEPRSFIMRGQPARANPQAARQATAVIAHFGAAPPFASEIPRARNRP